ncbi:MAG: hypothetical protein GXP32_02330 [Kiritimatiellaeota bacterium]|nr:hypothetical protein [Kiritimatiellota bacterium]
MSEPSHKTSAGKKAFRFSIRGEIVAAVLVPLALLAFVRRVAFKTENSVDAYYHAAVADFGPSYYTAKTISHLTMSVWSDGFSDKELGYHLMLSGIRGLMRSAGLEEKPPFNIDALFFDFLVVLSFVFACVVFGVERRNIIFFSVALVVISPFFTDRLLMLRPHNLSIALMLVACAVFHAARGSRVVFPAAFTLGFASAWCYSNPHFLLLPALAFGIADGLSSGADSASSTSRSSGSSIAPCAVSKESPSPALRLAWSKALWLPAAVLAGIALGYTLHPQFPNTFSNWWIQCVEVPWQALTGSETIALGGEFNRPGMVWFAKNALPYIVFGAAALIFAKLAERRDHETRISALRRMDPTAAAMFAAAAVVVAATPLGMRAMEYACPFVLLSLAANLAALKRVSTPPPKAFGGSGFSSRLKLLIVVLAAAFVVFQTESYSKRSGGGPLTDFAAYTRRSGIPPGTVIANLAWSDYPFLLYSCPEYKYISGMDPMFSYSVAPGKVVALENFRRGKLKLTPKELKNLVGTKYLFLRKIYKRYAKIVRGIGCVVLYEGPDGWLFEIPSSPRSKSSFRTGSN